MAATPTKKPSLGRIPKDAPKETTKFLQTIKEILEVGEGRRGHSLDRYITYRNLIDSGLAESLSNGSLVASPVIPTYSDVTQFPGYTTQTPEAPANVTVTGGYSFVGVKWDTPADVGKVVASAEVWRSETDNLGSAAIVGTSPSSFYMDELGTESPTYFYWVRFVSKWSTAELPIYGPYNAVSGTPGATAMDPEYVIDQITGRLNSGALPEDKKFIIESENFGIKAPGAEKFALVVGTVNGVQTVGIGNAHIIDLAVTNAAVQSLAADKLFALSGTIAKAVIGNGDIENAMIGNVIQSHNYVPGVSGWIINKDGNAELQNATVKGNVTANSIDANAVNIISTDMLVSQAVTFPVSHWVNSQNQVTFSGTSSYWNTVTSDHVSNVDGSSNTFKATGWATISSVTFQSSGAPKYVSGFFRFRYIEPTVTLGAYYGIAGADTFFIEFRVIKNVSTEMLKPLPIIVYKFAYPSGSFQVPEPIGDTEKTIDHSFSFPDDSLNEESTTYSVQIRALANFNQSGNLITRINFWERSLFMVETKK